MSDYKQVVERHFAQNWEWFRLRLKQSYPFLRHEDIEDIYQEAWIDAYDNVTRGMVRRDTNWRNYILKIGLNKASKKYHVEPVQVPIESDNEGQLVLGKLNDLTVFEDDTPSLSNIDLQGLIGKVFKSMGPGLCPKILDAYYFQNMSMAEIATLIHSASADSVKTRKNRCLTDFTRLLLIELTNRGIKLTPKRR